MKTKRLLLLICYFYLIQFAFAQDPYRYPTKNLVQQFVPQQLGLPFRPTIRIINNNNLPSIESEEDSSTLQAIEEIKNQLSEIKKIIVENGEDGNSIVGKVYLKKRENVTLYEYNWVGKADKLKGESNFDVLNIKASIESVHILSKNGYIIEIIVKTKTGIFKNWRGPIEISERRFSKSDMLGNGENQYIDIDEILDYESIKPYAPDDDDFLLTNTDTIHNFSKGFGINSIFDIRLYSDAFGIFGKKANGLVQTDIYFKYLYYRSNVFNTGIFFSNYFKLNLTGSKFDSKLAYTDSVNFTRTSLYRKSWFNFDLAGNIINGWIGHQSPNSYYIDGGVGLSLSELATSNDTSTIVSPHFFFQSGVDFVIQDNCGVSISTKFIWTYAPEIEFGTERYERRFNNTAVSFFWNPLGNRAGRVFARLAYNVDFSDIKNHFLQFQFGCNVLLTSLVK